MSDRVQSRDMIGNNSGLECARVISPEKQTSDRKTGASNIKEGLISIPTGGTGMSGRIIIGKDIARRDPFERNNKAPG